MYRYEFREFVKRNRIHQIVQIAPKTMNVKVCSGPNRKPFTCCERLLAFIITRVLLARLSFGFKT